MSKRVANKRGAQGARTQRTAQKHRDNIRRRREKNEVVEEDIEAQRKKEALAKEKHREKSKPQFIQRVKNFFRRMM